METEYIPQEDEDNEESDLFHIHAWMWGVEALEEDGYTMDPDTCVWANYTIEDIECL